MDWDNLLSGFVGGAIGAVGGIIGGSLTLIGVRWTLKNQNKDKLIDGFPKKLLKIDEIVEIIEKLYNSFDGDKSNRYSSDDERNEDIKNSIRISSEIDAEFYNYMKEIEKLFEDYLIEIKNPKLQEYETNSDGNTDYTIEVNEKRKKIIKLIKADLFVIKDKIHASRNKFINAYEKMTKIK